MAEIINDEKAQELERKLKSRTRVRGLLIALNIVLVAYLVYSVTDAVIAIARESRKSEDFVVICGKSEKGSKKLYDKHVKDVTYGDFMTFNDKLTLTNGNYSSDDVKLFGKVQLVNVCPSVIAIESDYKYSSMNTSLNNGISMFYDNSESSKILDEGDYLFYTDYIDAEHMGKTLKVATNKNIKQIFYSNQLNDGRRIQTTIYAYEKNPALVMNVKYVANLPENYYDVILKGDDSGSKIAKQKLEQRHFKVGVIPNAKDEDYFFASSRVIVDFIKGEEEKISVHSRVDFPFEKVDDPFNQAMLGYSISTGSLNDFYSDHYSGKLVIAANFISEPSDNYWNFLDKI